VFQQIEAELIRALRAHLAIRYGLDTPVLLEQPKQPSFGELAVPLAFQLARQLKQSPRAIAQSLISELGQIEGIAAFEVAGNGYINVRFDRGRYGLGLLAAGGAAPRKDEAGKIIVEHTNINPNKAAHIGHLRNAILGDTFVRMLRFGGYNVEVQNYIDNTGVQVADVVVAFLLLYPHDDVAALAAQPGFDYLCWDRYAQISAHYAVQPDALAKRGEVLHAIEHQDPAVFKLAMLVADSIVRCHLTTMSRLGIHYDVLPRESEIIAMQFWATAFKQLKLRGAVHLEIEGKNQGCWVMRGSAFSSDTENPDDKVIVRSNNTVTYVGKDIAYQLWKFGLLGKDFFYRTGPEGNWPKLYVTTADASQAEPVSFGKGSRVYNVIDSRQSYLQDVVVAGLRALDYQEQADRSIHFSYEMVALSPRTCVEMGIELSEEDKRRPYVEVSGRKGLGVKADDLIDKLIEKALAEVDARHPEAPADERRNVATGIATGALRYFMLKFTRNSVIAFDFQEALSFEGETGPYVQYAAVRARNILRKLVERGETLPDFSSALNRGAMDRQLAEEDLWQLLLNASKAEVAVSRAVESGEPAHVAKYAFQLAQAFNNFYHGYQVLSEQDREKKVFLLWMTEYFRAQLERTLGVLGIEIPPYM
jgi:arginyl-tRNA synthetase